MLAGRLPVAVVTLAVLVGAHAAHAHGIAGNRFFPGTLTFDDPAVADEAIVPLFSTFKHPAEIGDGNVVDNAFNWVSPPDPEARDRRGQRLGSPQLGRRQKIGIRHYECRPQGRGLPERST
jgi:hypothetical protein